MTDRNNNIRVTALVSCYNGSKYIRQCLDNLIEQTLFKKGELEVFVLDADSSENEYEIIQPFIDRYSESIRYLRLNQRKSLYTTWNTGAKLARGEYLTNANVDDRHHPQCLELLAGELSKQDEIGMVYGLQYVESKPNSRFDLEGFKEANWTSSFFGPLALIYHPCGCQPMWRKSIHYQIGGFDESFNVIGDYDFTLRVFEVAGIKRVDSALGYFLHRKDSLSATVSSAEWEQFNRRHRSIENVLKVYDLEWKRSFPEQIQPGKSKYLFDWFKRCLAFPHVWGGKLHTKCELEWAKRAMQEACKGKHWQEARCNVEQLHQFSERSCLEVDSYNFRIPESLNWPDNFEFLFPKPDVIPTSFNIKNPIKQEDSELTIEASVFDKITLGFDSRLLLEWIERKPTVRPVFIWGVGRRADQIRRCLEKEGIRFDGWVDRNSENFSNSVSGAKLFSPDEIYKTHTNPLIVVGAGDVESVIEAAQKLGFELGEDIFFPSE